jgi:dipeptidyl-peptidase-4
MSAALLAAGRPHQVLPLSGATHLPASEAAVEGLLRFQLEFLRDALESPGADVSEVAIRPTAQG